MLVVTKRLTVTAIGVAALFVAIAAVYYQTTQAEDEPTVITSPVTRGDVVETVDATGTLQAVTTVQVGTQVSGTIKALRADFNSRVRRGQVIAELDASLFEAQVQQARASLMRLEAEATRARVQLEDAHRKLRRARELAERQLIATMDLEAAEMNASEAEAALKAAEAQVVQGRASLNQNEVNLAHTIIAAPIDGIVISRNVDVGQTVAASMQAPTLFVLARDLAEMQVNASIAESDIGRIQPGQSASFRVDAYPRETFTGRVSQVRLEPVVQQNVVSYVTIISVPNPALKLKPGMTATVTVEIARASNVLRLPNAALRLRPSPDVLKALGAKDSGDRHAAVWVSEKGRLERVPVQVTITDGTVTAMASGALPEGAQVVTAVTSSSTTGTTTSPLLPFGGRGGGGRGGPARQSGR
jgi:HlyD family secretion protein